MGGQVFSTAHADGYPAIETPRMNPPDYFLLKGIYTKRLEAYFGFGVVISFPEAPKKQNFGDIDFSIARDGLLDWADVADKIGASAWFDRGGQKASFAVRLDGERRFQPSPVQYFRVGDGGSLKRQASPESPEEAAHDTYAQLDLERIDPELKDWAKFYGSYGDAAGILGNAVTNLGFEVTDRGLRLRLQELDEAKEGGWEHFVPANEDGKMILSSDPLKVMEFFGLSTERHSAGFDSEEALFQWLSECPAMTEQCLKREKRQGSMDSRIKIRPMFGRFFREWLPAHLAKKEANETTTDAEAPQTHNGLSNMRDKIIAGCFDSLTLSDMRAIYLAESLTFFNKREQHMKLYLAFMRKRGNKTAEGELKSMLMRHSQKKAQSESLKELVRAFRRNVFYDEKASRSALLAQSVEDDDSQLFTLLDEGGRELRSREKVEEWVKQNFDHVKFVERERAKARKG